MDIDVDHALVLAHGNELHLRPGARRALARLRAAGRRVFLCSAGGASSCERVVALHGRGDSVDGCHAKDPRVPPRPDVIVDDDPYLVEKYGGFAVRPFRALDPHDTELMRVVEELAALGSL